MTQTTIRIPTPLRSFTGGSAELEVGGSTVREALSRAGEEHQDFPSNVLDDSGELRSFVNVFLGSKNLTQLDGLDTPLGNGEVLTILPAVAGGSAR